MTMTDARISLASSGIKVNVGCGVTPTAGWLNFDNSLSVRMARWAPVTSILAKLHIVDPASVGLVEMAQRGLVRFANAATRIPCASGSVAVVYSSHMIEHLDRNEARAFLAEVKRILRPGGTVRLAAPDLSRLVRTYVSTGNADDFVAGTHMGLNRPSGVRAWLRWAVAGPRHHLWMYDGESLSRLLRDAGFLDVAVRQAGTTGIPDPGQLDLLERADESVYVEGVRPA
jgi:SAM-dependent methyltransferase